MDGLSILTPLERSALATLWREVSPQDAAQFGPPRGNQSASELFKLLPGGALWSKSRFCSIAKVLFASTERAAR